MAESDEVELPIGDANESLDLEETSKEETKENKQTEFDRLKDFFFPKKHSSWPSRCECGKDTVGDAGKHSPWCPAYK